MFELENVKLVGKPYFGEDTAWVPPMNFDPTFREKLDLRGPFYVYDVTLRDGEQTPGVAFTTEEKIKIAEELDQLGVESIEVGVPMVEKDFKAIAELRTRGLSAKVGCLTRANRKDIDLAVDAGAQMVCVEHSVNPYSCKLAYDIDEKELIARNADACAYAKEKGFIVNWMGWDAFRQPIEYIESVFKGVVEAANPDRVTIADTFGMTHPIQVYELFKTLRSWFPDKMLEYHCHNDYGMAVANAVSAVTGGANSVHTAINGLGERAGNISLEEFAMATQVAMGIDFGIDLRNLNRVSTLATQFSRFPVAPNKPVVGSNLFNVDSGMIIHIFKAADRTGFPRTIMLPYQPAVVGRSDFRYVYGKGAGGAALSSFLEELGYVASDEQKSEILSKLKEEACLRKAFLSEDEFRHIVESVIK
jgi:isopropylmalate/homocitrate/citramalate synthase